MPGGDVSALIIEGQVNSLLFSI